MPAPAHDRRRSAGCARTCSPARSTPSLTMLSVLLIYLDRAAAHRIHAHRMRCGAAPTARPACRPRSGPRSAPAGPSCATASPISSTAPIRSRSAGASTSSSRCWPSASSGCCWLEAPRRDLGALYFFVVVPIVSYSLLTGVPLIGLRNGRYLAVGRRAGHDRGVLGRHRRSRCRSASCWRSGGARTCRP